VAQVGKFLPSKSETLSSNPTSPYPPQKMKTEDWHIVEYDPFWQLICKHCFQTESNLGIELAVSSEIHLYTKRGNVGCCRFWQGEGDFHTELQHFHCDLSWFAWYNFDGISMPFQHTLAA
jgi:hypothetical protein